jgi:hypothetical protein
MQKNRGITPVIIFLLVTAFAGIGAVAYLNWSKELGRGTETQEELKGFQKYTNENLGVSFSYPNDWTQGTSSNGKEIFNLLKDKNRITLDLLGPFKCLCTSKELEQIIISNTIFDGSGLSPKSIDEFKKINYNGNIFYKVRTGRFEGVLSYSYYLPLQNKVLVFSFVSYGVDWTNPNLDEENDSSHLVLKNILSTIKIGDKKEDTSFKIDTSNWKTYRNDEYGFEFKYPANWKKEEGRLTDENSLYSFSLIASSTEDFLNKYPGTGSPTYDISIVLYKLNYRDDFSNRISTPIVFNGIKGDRVVYRDNGLGTSTSMYLDGKNYSFQINLGGRNRKESEKILSTFKFIDKNPSSDKPALNTKPCFVGGCSSQLCTDNEDGAVSTCEWQPQYICYKTAKCERQSNGQCGWTNTPSLQRCLATPPLQN